MVYAQNLDTVLLQPVALQLLPVQLPAMEKSEEQKKPYIFEGGGAPRIFRTLVARYVESQVYQALVETVASTQASQMVAMKNATRRANEMVQDLILVMNKARQENITMQILDMITNANLTEEYGP